MNNYQKQANDFLKKTNTEIKTVYWKYDTHFVGETQSRHIYTITIKRNGKHFSFKFGQSIADGKTDPSAYDILACLQKYDIGSFEDFCDSFGYEKYQDGMGMKLNKISNRIYNTVCKEYENLCNLYNSEEIDELAEIN